ncbi:claspin-like [Pollicipes pollicipes]|uniref:claspin-like n=1 Tax=Pollicipes pollicipes TaxID=41117 RepID=UPI001885734F|nr:claspin-like [Pollicipes pollicipes]
MAAAVVDSSIQMNIVDSSLGSTNDPPPDQPDGPLLPASSSPATDCSGQMANSALTASDALTGADDSDNEPTSGPTRARHPAVGSDGDSAGPGRAADDSGTDVEADAVPARMRVRRLVIESDEEERGAAGGGDQEEVDDAAAGARQEGTGTAAVTSQARRRTCRLASDSEEEDEEVQPGGGAGGATAAGDDKVKTDGAEDAAAAAERRRERNLKQLLALGDSPSEEDERPEQALTTDLEHGEEAGSRLPAEKKKSHKKLQQTSPRKSGKEAAEQMRQIRSAAQRRTRESRLNLPYHRPRQRTLHEFLSRRQRAAPMSDDLRLSRADVHTVSRRLEETEKEIEEFYRSASEPEDGANSDPEWAPIDTTTAAAAAAATAAATATVAAGVASASALATRSLEDVPERAPDPEEDDAALMSQSSQKVQEWLVGVQQGATDADAAADDTAMTDAGDAASARAPEPATGPRCDVVSLDSDDEGPPGPAGLDELVQRFIRHSSAKPKTAEKKTINIRWRLLLSTVRRRREEARQRRERQYRLDNEERVDDSYLDDLPDEEAEPSDVSSGSGESEPEEEAPLVDKPRPRCSLVDDEADDEENGYEDEDEDHLGKDGDSCADAVEDEDDDEEDELNLVLEDDDGEWY